jgi:hypothetical protein
MLCDHAKSLDVIRFSRARFNRAVELHECSAAAHPASTSLPPPLQRAWPRAPRALECGELGGPARARFSPLRRCYFVAAEAAGGVGARDRCRRAAQHGLACVDCRRSKSDGNTTVGRAPKACMTGDALAGMGYMECRAAGSRRCPAPRDVARRAAPPCARLHPHSLACAGGCAGMQRPEVPLGDVWLRPGPTPASAHATRWLGLWRGCARAAATTRRPSSWGPR